MNGASTNGWTSGQYGLYRVLFGVSLFWHLGWSTSGVAGWLGLAIAALFVLGRADRIVAGAGLVLALSQGFLFAAVLLALHLAVPSHPDPHDDPREWSLPDGVQLGARVLVAVIWALAIWQGSLELVPGVAAAHLLALEPAWIRAVRSGPPATLFYDGHCALCHATVRRVLAEDPDGAAFRFAPLESERFGAIRADQSEELPDSVVLHTDGALLVRSAAVLEMAERLGGLWRAGAVVLDRLPPSWLDAAYDAIAARRVRWFGRTSDACPLVPADLRARFDA